MFEPVLRPGSFGLIAHDFGEPQGPKILLTRETLRPAAFAISLVFISLPSAKRLTTVKAMGFPRSRHSRDCLYSASSTDASITMFSQSRKDENMISRRCAEILDNRQGNDTPWRNSDVLAASNNPVQVPEELQFSGVKPSQRYLKFSDGEEIEKRVSRKGAKHVLSEVEGGAKVRRNK